MEWPDDEFEAFLRQFRPRKPKALPTHRRTIVFLTTAAVIVVAVLTQVWTGSNDRTATDSTPTPASTPPANGNPAGSVNPGIRPDMPSAAPLNRRSETNAPPDAMKSRTVVSASPTPLLQGVKPEFRPSNGPVSATSGAGTRRLRVGGDIRPPRKVVDVKPEYPDEAKTAGIEGIVILEVVIGEDGTVIEADVVLSIPELDQAAIDAVRQWAWEPTLLNGEPVEVKMRVTINFTLQ